MWLNIGSVIFVFIAIGYYVFSDYLPPRTPLKIVRLKSGLKVPKSIQVLDFEENYSLTGEGYEFVVIKLNKDDVNSIMHECICKKYKKLTIDNLVKDGFIDRNPEFGIILPKKDIRSINEGYYQLNVTDLQQMDFSITILDMDKGELIIYVSFP